MHDRTRGGTIAGENAACVAFQAHSMYTKKKKKDKVRYKRGNKSGVGFPPQAPSEDFMVPLSATEGASFGYTTVQKHT